MPGKNKYSHFSTGNSTSSKLEQSEGWSVSYSDLLMVLMSFFIVFFNINDSESVDQDNFNKVVLEIANISTHKTLSRLPSSNSDDSNNPKNNIQIVKFSIDAQENVKDLKSRNLQLDEDLNLLSGQNTKAIPKDSKEIVSYSGTEVNIDLPANLFDLGSFELSNTAKLQLDKVLKIVQPYQSSLKIIFLGHTDDTQFGSSAKNIINNNLILSNIRAVKAVEYAVSKGIKDDVVFAQGLVSHERKTRSLSIRLVKK